MFIKGLIKFLKNLIYANNTCSSIFLFIKIFLSNQKSKIDHWFDVAVRGVSPKLMGRLDAVPLLLQFVCGLRQFISKTNIITKI